MERISEIMTIVAGVLLAAYTAYEINRRRQRLHDLYDVLGREELPFVASLEELAAKGVLKAHGRS